MAMENFMVVEEILVGEMEHDKFYEEIKRKNAELKKIYDQMQITVNKIADQSGYAQTDLMVSKLNEAIREVENLSKVMCDTANGLV